MADEKRSVTDLINDFVSRQMGYPSAQAHREKLALEVRGFYLLFRDADENNKARMIGEAFDSKQAAILLWFLLEARK
jgi:hypothetical protein